MSKANPTTIMVRLCPCIGGRIALGSCKIDLLRMVGETRSISAAARALGMPYKKARSLIQGFGRSVIVIATGGKGGGGATLTPLGLELLARWFPKAVSRTPLSWDSPIILYGTQFTASP